MSTPLVGPLSPGRTGLSFEFMPPRDDAGEDRLWRTVAELARYRPDFVSVTYGAGGSTRDRTIRIAHRLVTETGVPVVGHLTCVGQSIAELIEVLAGYAEAGIQTVLALRGDPAAGPGAPWEPTPGGLTYACELVELVKARGGFEVGVAAFPDRHPAAVSLDQDADVLAAKARLGASFAITQLFFRAEDYVSLVGRVRARGVDIPILPGVMPITNFASVQRMAELSGAVVPAALRQRFEGVEDSGEVSKIGLDVVANLCQDLREAGAPGLHFFTLNRSVAMRALLDAVGIGVSA